MLTLRCKISVRVELDYRGNTILGLITYGKYRTLRQITNYAVHNTIAGAHLKICMQAGRKQYICNIEMTSINC